MNDAPPPLLRFRGTVRREDGPGPAGVTLLGSLVSGPPDPQAGPVQLSLVCGERPQLPAELLDPTVQVLTPAQLLLRSGSREWRVTCRAWQLHQDVGARFYAVVPPRPTPWARRVSWRVLLGIAGTRIGRWLLLRRSRTGQP